MEKHRSQPPGSIRCSSPASRSAGRTRITPAASGWVGARFDWLSSIMPAVPGTWRSVGLAEHRLLLVWERLVVVKRTRKIRVRSCVIPSGQYCIAQSIVASQITLQIPFDRCFFFRIIGSAFFYVETRTTQCDVPYGLHLHNMSSAFFSCPREA